MKKDFDLKRGDRAFIIMNMPSFSPSMTRYMSAMILADDKVPVPVIASLMSVRRGTIRSWLARYRTGGLGAFIPGM